MNIRSLIRAMVVEALVVDGELKLDHVASTSLNENGWTVVTISAGQKLMMFLRNIRADGLHAATHNDGSEYAVLVSKKPIKSVRGACKKISASVALQRKITIKTLSIRF